MKYSRLTALQQMGTLEDYSIIHKKSAIIIGIGGIGSVTAEMLCRCGIGKLVLVDYDHVEESNMNRMFYLPKHVGLLKTQAASSTLNELNPQIIIQCLPENITLIGSYQKLIELINKGGINESKIDIVLCCVDNYAARTAINAACISTNQTWIESGVSENAMNGHIQLFIPGNTSCYQCAPPLIVAMDGDESKIKRDKVCTASLPTTMSIIAGLLAQNTLMYMLKFGSVASNLFYSGLSNNFYTIEMKPNPECTVCNKIHISKEESKSENNIDLLRNELSKL